MRRIGLYGGTFDPPHKGHIAIAKQAKEQLGLDCVYFIPAYIPPHKQQLGSSTARHRLNMMKLAVKGRKGFKVSTIELQRRGISYTIDTVQAFKRRYPKSEIMLIIGADNLAQFHSWKSPHTILKLASLAVYKRTGYLLNNCDINFILLKGRMLRISSTEIRNKIERGFPIQTLVPGSIVLYIKQHSLYSTWPHPPKKRQFHENHRVF